MSWLVSLSLTKDKPLEERARRKFQSDNDALEALGFEYYGLFTQSHSPILAPGMLLFALYLEVWKLDRSLGITWAHCLYYSKSSSTFAYAFGLGVRFWTFFEDGSGLCTMNFETDEGYDRDTQIHRQMAPGSVADAERLHQHKAKHLQTDTNRILENVNHEKFIEFEAREGVGYIMVGISLVVLVVILWIAATLVHSLS